MTSTNDRGYARATVVENACHESPAAPRRAVPQHAVPRRTAPCGAAVVHLARTDDRKNWSTVMSSGDRLERRRRGHLGTSERTYRYCRSCRPILLPIFVPSDRNQSSNRRLSGRRLAVKWSADRPRRQPSSGCDAKCDTTSRLDRAGRDQHNQQQQQQPDAIERPNLSPQIAAPKLALERQMQRVRRQLSLIHI